jgi:hypothetical protein
VKATYKLAGMQGFKGEYERYGMLCWAKHGNPRFLRMLPVIDSDEAHVVNASPSVTPRTARWAEIAVWAATNPPLVATLALIQRGVVPLETVNSISKLSSAWSSLDRRLTKTGPPPVHE